MELKISRGMEKKATLGKIVGRIPFGYRIKSNKVVIDEDCVALIQLVFKLYYDEGWGFNDIANHLNQQEMLRYGKMWHRGAVKRMVENRTYYGMTKFKGKEYVGNFPAIIEKEQLVRGVTNGRGGGFS